MKKLSLRLEELRVETFETAADERQAGTVLGNQDTASCPGYSCAPTCGIVLSPGLARGADVSYPRNCCV